MTLQEAMDKIQEIRARGGLEISRFDGAPLRNRLAESGYVYRARRSGDNERFYLVVSEHGVQVLRNPGKELR